MLVAAGEPGFAPLSEGEFAFGQLQALRLTFPPFTVAGVQAGGRVDNNVGAAARSPLDDCPQSGEQRYCGVRYHPHGGGSPFEVFLLPSRILPSSARRRPRAPCPYLRQARGRLGSACACRMPRGMRAARPYAAARNAVP